MITHSMGATWAARSCSCGGTCRCTPGGGCSCRRACRCTPDHQAAEIDPLGLWEEAADDREFAQQELLQELRRRPVRAASRLPFRQGGVGRGFSPRGATPAVGRAALRRRLQLADRRAQARRMTAIRRRNSFFAAKLGWAPAVRRIARVIGCRACPPGSPTFVGAMARWQLANGLPATGVLGPAAWERMKQILEQLAEWRRQQQQQADRPSADTGAPPMAPTSPDGPVDVAPSGGVPDEPWVLNEPTGANGPANGADDPSQGADGGGDTGGPPDDGGAGPAGDEELFRQRRHRPWCSSPGRAAPHPHPHPHPHPPPRPAPQSRQPGTWPPAAFHPVPPPPPLYPHDLRRPFPGPTHDHRRPLPRGDP